MKEAKVRFLTYRGHRIKLVAFTTYNSYRVYRNGYRIGLEFRTLIKAQEFIDKMIAEREA